MGAEELDVGAISVNENERLVIGASEGTKKDSKESLRTE